MEEVGKRALGCEKIKAIRFFLAFLLLVIWIVISARDSWASDEEAVYDVSCSSRFFTITNYSVFNKDEKKSYESTGWSNCDGKELIAYGEAGKTHIMVGEYVDIIFSHAAGYALEDGGTPSNYDGDIENGAIVDGVNASWRMEREYTIKRDDEYINSKALVDHNIFKENEDNGEGYVIERACIGTFQSLGTDFDKSSYCNGKNFGEGKNQEVRSIFVSPNNKDEDTAKASINYVGPFHKRVSNIMLNGEEYVDIDDGDEGCSRKESVAGEELYYTDYSGDSLKCSRRRFNARDHYRIRFNKPGEYYFCESIAVFDAKESNKVAAKTIGCVKVVVDGATVQITTDEVFAGETANVKHNFSFRNIYDNERAKVIVYASRMNESIINAQINKEEVTCFYDGFSVLAQNCKEYDLSEVFAGGSNSETINVFDVSAGNYYCAVVTFWPFNSENKSWYVSKPDCKKIGKKPSLQVWGAGIYTAGDIALNNAEKRVVNGIYDFTLKNQSNTTVFGTWVEQNILANGIVNTASGAATGRKDGELGGSKEGKNLSICIRSPLTMPNKNCSPIVKPGGGSFARPEDKGKLIDKLKENNCKQESSIGELSVKKGESYFYCSGGNFTINGNIRYEDGYNMISDIPKTIVYSKRDIIIGCGVTRIDAVLIAEGIINTCNNNDVNSRDRSNQLKINGAIIANKLKANRTYGASAGMESGTPAEIINYDTSLYLWGASESDVTKTGKLKVVYQTELPPRL